MFWRFLLLLFVCKFFIQHLLPPHVALLCYRFQYHKHVYVSLRDLHGFNSTATLCASQAWLHYNHCCIIDSICSYIANFSRRYGITIIPTSPFFYITHVITLQLLLHCWFFYSMESNYFSTSCVVSNYCVFMFFVGFSILWLQPHKHRVGDCVLQRCIPFFLSGSICFVVCIDFNVNQFCFIEFGVHFQFVFLWRKCLCVYNHEHCSMKYFFPLVFVLLYNV
jgi:hypothetical protein